MKMVAAAKLRRAQENVVAARPYAHKLRSVMQKLATSGGSTGHPLLQRENADKALLIVITSDRGLCGSFNANISKTAERFIMGKSGQYSELTVMAVGRKGNDYLKSRAKIRKNYSGILSNLNYQTAALIAQEVSDGFLAGEYGEVYLLYNAFKSVMSQDITMIQLLPITPPEGQEEEFRPEAIYEPGKEELLAELLPKNIEVQIFHALLESIAAEHGARMTAMDSASKNASEMIGKLTLQYNRARQAAITKELLEIISGAESIKG
jgi:F-type H+-transporting ATPase subunit gamma